MSRGCCVIHKNVHSSIRQMLSFKKTCITKYEFSFSVCSLRIETYNLHTTSYQLQEHHRPPQTHPPVTLCSDLLTIFSLALMSSPTLSFSVFPSSVTQIFNLPRSRQVVLLPSTLLFLKMSFGWEESWKCVRFCSCLWIRRMECLYASPHHRFFSKCLFFGSLHSYGNKTTS